MDDGQDRVPPASGENDPDSGRRSAARVPRWYAPSLVGLGVVVGIVYLATGGVVTAVGVAVGALLIGLAAVAALVVRVVRRGEPPQTTSSSGSGTDVEWSAGNGAAVFMAVVWIVLGVVQLMTSGSALFSGAVIGFGVLTLLAFGPPWWRSFAVRRSSRAASVVRDPPD